MSKNDEDVQTAKEMAAHLETLLEALVDNTKSTELHLERLANESLSHKEDLQKLMKVVIDGNAVYRHKDIQAMEDPSQEDEREARAAEWDLNYVALTGNIGCMVNGAGLAMGTMDIVSLHGGFPANFLDVGGGATKERVTEAFKIILEDSKVKAVLVNIFGGIVRCDMIAEGIIGAVKEVGVNVPVVVRLEGTNAELGRDVLKNSGLDIIAAESLTDAAEKVVAAAEGK